VPSASVSPCRRSTNAAQLYDRSPVGATRFRRQVAVLGTK
jgi:hypothetical protein